MIEQLHVRLASMRTKYDKLKAKLRSVNPDCSECAESDDELEEILDFMIPYMKRAAVATGKHRWQLLSEDAVCSRKRREYLVGQRWGGTQPLLHGTVSSKDKAVTAAFQFLSKPGRSPMDVAQELSEDLRSRTAASSTPWKSRLGSKDTQLELRRLADSMQFTATSFESKTQLSGKPPAPPLHRTPIRPSSTGPGGAGEAAVPQLLASTLAGVDAIAHAVAQRAIPSQPATDAQQPISRVPSNELWMPGTTRFPHSRSDPEASMLRTGSPSPAMRPARALRQAAQAAVQSPITRTPAARGAPPLPTPLSRTASKLPAPEAGAALPMAMRPPPQKPGQSRSAREPASVSDWLCPTYSRPGMPLTNGGRAGTRHTRSATDFRLLGYKSDPAESTEVVSPEVLPALPPGRTLKAPSPPIWLSFCEGAGQA